METKNVKLIPEKLNDTVVKLPKKAEGSEITVKQFLDFLKTAYQVNDSVENVLLAGGMTESVNWIRLKESELVRPREIACQTSEDSLKDKKELQKKISDCSHLSFDSCGNLKNKLHEVLSEGVMDSVLSYLVPSNTSLHPPSRRSSQQKLSEKNSNSSNSYSSEKALCRRKSGDTSMTSFKSSRSDAEVVIHVCDELKGAKKDFVCNQKLLVEKMGYFADVTAGQRLEDMDISVHCEISIFEWLMRWVKRDLPPEEGEEENIGALELDPQCVIPVLVSAAFLQMDPLLQECLLFCHRYMNDILKTSTNLSCLNDSLVTRLAAMYTNAEVESIRDRKDKIQSRLYCKLIQSLCDVDPESMRGHWSSLARSYRCNYCKQLVSPSVSLEVPCVPSHMRLLCDGSVVFLHERDPIWNITEYVESLFRSLKSWRRVYWHLWGDAHFLYCTVCKRYFPANQISWCRFHPDPPQFFTVDAQRASLPVGRFPCCGDRAYRFQVLEGESGCQFQEHIPSTETVRDAAILSMLEHFRSLIEEEAPKLMFPERLTRLVAKSDDKEGCEGKSQGNHHFWWKGLELIPPRPKLGLFGSFHNLNINVNCDEMPVPVETIPQEDDDSDSSSSDSAATSSSSTQKSEESYHSPQEIKKVFPRIRKRNYKFWQSNLSARSNQDIQRAHEESSLKHISTILGRKILFSMDQPLKHHSNKLWPRHITPLGGVWVRLESEWRERNNLPQPPRIRGNNMYPGKSRGKSNRIC